MLSISREEKFNRLREELRALERRVEETQSKSNDAFNLGGDGWHDNSAYHLMISEIDKLGAMIDQIKEEMKQLESKVSQAVIIHGTKGRRDGNWFPYLEKELLKLNFIVVRPQFPTPVGQTLNNWFKVWKREVRDLNSNAVIIGHSSAGAFILRILERLKNPILAGFLVAPFIADLGLKEFDELNSRFYRRGYNWSKIKRNCRNFFVYASTDDPYVPLDRSQEVAERLGIEAVFVKGAGHFNDEGDLKKFSGLLRDIKNTIRS